MKKVALLAGCLFFVSCGGGGGGSESSASACNSFKVLNGQECASDSTPVVRLTTNGIPLCTGTIISNDEVLTAAHCVLGVQSWTAEHDRGTQSSTAAVINPFYSSSSAFSAFDTALIRFPNIATNFNVSPAHFSSSRRTAVGDVIKVVGYGDDGTPTLPNNNPRGVELLVELISGGFLQTSFNTNNAGACFGDSGGAATSNGLIVGTVVGGDVDSCAEAVGFFTDIQTRGNVDFIRAFAPTAIFE